MSVFWSPLLPPSLGVWLFREQMCTVGWRRQKLFNFIWILKFFCRPLKWIQSLLSLLAQSFCWVFVCSVVSLLSLSCCLLLSLPQWFSGLLAICKLPSICRAISTLCLWLSVSLSPPLCSCIRTCICVHPCRQTTYGNTTAPLPPILSLFALHAHRCLLFKCIYVHSDVSVHLYVFFHIIAARWISTLPLVRTLYLKNAKEM